MQIPLRLYAVLVQKDAEREDVDDLERSWSTGVFLVREQFDVQRFDDVVDVLFEGTIYRV